MKGNRIGKKEIENEKKEEILHTFRRGVQDYRTAGKRECEGRGTYHRISEKGGKMCTEYAVIITAENGEKQVCRFGLDGRELRTATAAIDLIESFNDLFPGYEYDWAPIRPRPEV